MICWSMKKRLGQEAMYLFYVENHAVCNWDFSEHYYYPIVWSQALCEKLSLPTQ